MHVYMNQLISKEGESESESESESDLSRSESMCERACVFARTRAFAELCDLPWVKDRGERQRGVVRAGEGDLHRSPVCINGAATIGSAAIIGNANASAV